MTLKLGISKIGKATTRNTQILLNNKIFAQIDLKKGDQPQRINGMRISLLLACLILSMPIHTKLWAQTIAYHPDSAIFQKWLYSHDEDSLGLEIYQSASSNTIQWARPGIKFNQNGTFVIYEFTPNDMQVRIHGVWKPVADRMITMSFPDGERQEYQIEIKEVKPQILKIKKL